MKRNKQESRHEALWFEPQCMHAVVVVQGLLINLILNRDKRSLGAIIIIKKDV